MTDNELLNQIKQSAEQITVPDSITPDRISSKLKNTTTPSAHFKFSPIKAASAAAVFLFIGILSGVTWHTVTAPSKSIFQESGVLTDTIPEIPDSQSASKDAPKRNAGTLYTVAESYDQLYDVLNAYEDSYYVNGYAVDGMDEATADVATGDIATMDIKESAIESEAAARGEETAKLSDQESYSTTNLQTEGVDESDLIKTDGSYIYTVKDQHVLITDTSNGILKQTASIHPDLDTADSILEIYVDNDALLLLVQHYDTSLEESSVYYDPDDDYSADDSDFLLPLEGTAKTSAVQTDSSTKLYIYDITDPASPVLQETATQDGFYYTSRKIGDIVYLFTQKSLSAPAVYQKGSGTEGGIIPCINDQEIAYDHIYLPEEGNNGLICASIDINNPKEAIDNIMIVYDYAEIYVSNHSIYLYRGNYQNNETLTELAKFQIDEGNINAVNAASIKGTINDTFAIQEYQNNLRILTTSYNNNGDTSNQLYLLDKDLRLIGSLEGLAKGEEIYAARYFENTAYFITYRNTDPLFAVDLSDPSNPTLLGELKISGFSEYLHFWENDKLLGIGYETDPDSGNFLGLKLVMFDISDPANLTALDSLVLKQYHYSPALYNYKCVLADSRPNLIGFAAETDYSDTNYNIYSWETDHFAEKKTEPLLNAYSSDSIRGLYINDKFYIASPEEITCFDMTDNFKRVSHITLQK